LNRIVLLTETLCAQVRIRSLVSWVLVAGVIEQESRSEMTDLSPLVRFYIPHEKPWEGPGVVMKSEQSDQCYIELLISILFLKRSQYLY